MFLFEFSKRIWDDREFFAKNQRNKSTTHHDVIVEVLHRQIWRLLPNSGAIVLDFVLLAALERTCRSRTGRTFIFRWFRKTNFTLAHIQSALSNTSVWIVWILTCDFSVWIWILTCHFRTWGKGREERRTLLWRRKEPSYKFDGLRRFPANNIETTAASAKAAKSGESW